MSAMQPAETAADILYERDGSTAWIRFNRPASMNAFTTAAYRLLAATIRRASQEDDVYCLIFIGEGGRAFSAGGDMRELAEDDEAQGDAGGTGAVEEVFAAFAACGKPMIAAIDGHCLAAGLEIASLCDIRLATEKTRLGLPEVRLSLMPQAGLIELPRLMPMGEVMKMVLTGTPISAERAYQLGLLQALLPDRDALIAEARRIAGEIALAAPLAVEAFKRTVRRGRDMTDLQAAHYRELEWLKIQATEDRLEGPRAFAEKRHPQWKRR